MKIYTFPTWVKLTGNKSCEWIDSSSWFYHSRRDRLIGAGFRCLTDWEDCSTAYETKNGKVVRLKPREAVLEFLDGYGYKEAVYYPDSLYYGNLEVWVK